ncbi:helix-turn-helix domain-containing protein [[Clostridium] spiroforme]|nr:helix-turn-helix domain-containing protein [Thomasclavelia spiroformis]MBM6881211.1 helix-turn-helix domain-containing protein [Thomasclavelia spiroformis]
MFQISASTLYRWIKRYNAYLRIFTFLKNRYHSHFFIHLLYDFSHVINDLFDLNLHTLFQYDRKLFNQRK